MEFNGGGGSRANLRRISSASRRSGSRTTAPSLARTLQSTNVRSAQLCTVESVSPPRAASAAHQRAASLQEASSSTSCPSSSVNSTLHRTVSVFSVPPGPFSTSTSIDRTKTRFPVPGPIEYSACVFTTQLESSCELCDTTEGMELSEPSGPFACNFSNSLRRRASSTLLRTALSYVAAAR